MKKIIAVMIVVFVVVFSCLFMIIPKKNYSENENRYFAKISKISFKKILSCEFQNSVTDYISDHFPFRDFLLGEKNKLYLDISSPYKYKLVGESIKSIFLPLLFKTNLLTILVIDSLLLGLVNSSIKRLSFV